jgi:hypothetical protein
MAIGGIDMTETEKNIRSLKQKEDEPKRQKS